MIKNFRETMTAEMVPDVYDGPECNRHRPQWDVSAEGDMDGPGPIGDVLELSARIFPPGTKVLVMEPECPTCHTVPHLMSESKEEQVWSCECDFDWKAFTEDQYS